VKDLDRRTALQLLGLSVLALQLSGCGEPGDPPMAISDVARAPQGDLVRSTLSRFAARLLDAMPDGNVVVSPASIAVVLAMVGNGAATTTRTQFENVLGSPIDALNIEFNGLTQRLSALQGQQGTLLTFWNALWLQKGHWEQSFLEAMKKWYGAGVRLADFTNDPAGTVTTINSWADLATEGLIPTIVDPSMVTTGTRIVAGNAVHIKGSWATPFMASLTSKQPFRTGSGAQVSTDTMHGTPRLKYLETGAMTSIALPFRHEDLAFIVALPASQGPLTLTALPDLCDVLDADQTELNLSLPKFHAEFDQALKSSLAGLGLVDAWSDAVADFSGMTGDRSLFLSFVQHKAVLSVDEKGAEGAAVTAGGATATSLPSLTFTVDRPFLWAIAHVPTKSLVMLGRESDPTS
jgi:serpin B